MTWINAAFAAILAAIAEPTAPLDEETCLGIPAGGGYSVEIDRFYGARVIEIIESARAGDTVSLDERIAPAARLELWRGDVAWTAPAGGSAGAMDFVQDLRPVHFQLVSERTANLLTDSPACTWSVTMLFRTVGRARSALVKFDFRDGMLFSAIGQEVAVTEGSVR